MGTNNYESLKRRILKSILESVESGNRLITRDPKLMDHHTFRAAANQFRQAAKDLDQLDGVLQAKFMLDMSDD